MMFEGSLEAKLPTIWRDENAGQLGRSSEMETIRREKMSVREKVAKSWEDAKHCVFPVFCGSEGSKGRLAKAAGAEVAGQMRDQKLHAGVARSTF